MSRMPMTCAILAGGLSSRFGSNKALALLQGRPLINRLADKISPLFNSSLLITNTPAEYSFLNIQIFGDVFAGLGPLAGIHAALTHSNSSYTFICACDMPLLSETMIRHLYSFTRSEYDIILPVSENGPEPLYAFYHKRLIPTIEANIDRGERRVKALLENKKLAIKRIEIDEVLSITGSMTTFFNINRQDDLTSLSRIVHDKHI